MNGQPQTSKTGLIKSIYFYLVSLITLVIIIFSTADLVNVALKVTIFTKADRVFETPCLATPPPNGTVTGTERFPYDCDAQKRNSMEEREAQRQRDLVRDIGLLAVAIPVFAWHYATIRRETREEKSEAEGKKN